MPLSLVSIQIESFESLITYSKTSNSSGLGDLPSPAFTRVYLNPFGVSFSFLLQAENSSANPISAKKNLFMLFWLDKVGLLKVVSVYRLFSKLGFVLW